MLLWQICLQLHTVGRWKQICQPGLFVQRALQSSRGCFSLCEEDLLSVCAQPRPTTGSTRSASKASVAAVANLPMQGMAHQLIVLARVALNFLICVLLCVLSQELLPYSGLTHPSCCCGRSACTFRIEGLCQSRLSRKELCGAVRGASNWHASRFPYL